MSRPKFTGYPSAKPKYYRELWNDGPVRIEARRLARLELRAGYAKKNLPFHELSEKAVEKLIDVLIFNSEDVFLKRAKFCLEQRGVKP